MLKRAYAEEMSRRIRERNEAEKARTPAKPAEPAPAKVKDEEPVPV
jgi:hypothetical protein